MKHLIAQAWEQFESGLRGAGAPQAVIESSKSPFVGGFCSAIGVLVGSVNVGIPNGTPTRDVVSHLLGEMEQLRERAMRDADDSARKLLQQSGILPKDET